MLLADTLDVSNPRRAQFPNAAEVLLKAGPADAQGTVDAREIEGAIVRLRQAPSP